MTTITARLIAKGHTVQSDSGPCEKCWADAQKRARRIRSKTAEEHYEDIVIEAESAEEASRD